MRQPPQPGSRGTAIGIAGGVVLALLLALPFHHTGNPADLISWLLQRYEFGSSVYAYNSVNAFNLWSIRGGFWNADSTPIGLPGFALPQYYWGIGLVVAALVLIVWRYVQERSAAAFLEACAIALIAFFVLSTRMHERYIFDGLTFTIACVPLARRYAWGTIALSVALYIVTLRYDLHLSTYPDGFWSFNPYAWQLLFVFGAWCALGGAQRLSRVSQSPVTVSIAAAYLLFAFVISLTWYLPGMSQYVPHWLEELIYPIDKSNLSPLRLLHFLALAVVGVRLTARDWRGPLKPLIIAMIRCGENSLAMYCLGVLLSFMGHVILLEFSGAIAMQVAVSISGIVLMSVVATLMTWEAKLDRRGPKLF